MKSATLVLGAALTLAACTPGATPPAPTSPSVPPLASPAASPVAAVSPLPSPAPTATRPPSPVAAAPTPTRGPAPTVAAGSSAKTNLPTVHATSSVPRDPNFMSEVWAEFQLATPITSEADLRRLVDGLLDLTGVAEVESDGAHLRIMYDTARLQPPRMRERLQELGHPATAGAEVPGPGDASD